MAVGETQLVFERDGERTVLASSRSALPLLVQRPITRPDGSALVTLLVPAGGLFGGDEIRLSIDCGPGTRVVVTQTSATLVHAGQRSRVTCEANFSVAAGALLTYRPKELIPFVDAEYVQSIRMHLQAGAQGQFGEVISPGPIAAQYRYRLLDLRTSVYLDGALLAIDALRIEPGETEVRSLLGGHTHLGSGLWLGPDLNQHDANDVHERLNTADTIGSASLLIAYGIAGRVLGRSADCLLQLIQADPTRHGGD